MENHTGLQELLYGDTCHDIIKTTNTHIFLATKNGKLSQYFWNTDRFIFISKLIFYLQREKRLQLTRKSID